MQLLIQFLFLVVLSSGTKAAEGENDRWDKIRFQGLAPGQTYAVSMGSGFFVNRNYIITNRHVVANCRNIAVRGAVPPSLVRLVILDPTLDLALLYSDVEPAKIPYLRINYDQISKNDLFFTVGYPLENGDTGIMVIRQAEVIDVTANRDNHFTSISFTDVVNHGNSGGPVLDRNANIAGVVVAKITYFQDEERTKPSKSIGMAIGLDGLIDFLRKNGIFFAANSTYDVFTNYKVEELVKDYVVNIHCVGDPL